MLLSDLDELPRLDEALLRMAPAHQRLDAGQPARAELHDRLVSQLQLIELDGLLELQGELVAGPDLRVHPRVEHGESSLAASFGHVHGDIGVADHVGCTVNRIPGAGDPDAGRDPDR